jgi:tRNA(fMet)-specific endonuclease VapC
MLDTNMISEALKNPHGGTAKRILRAGQRNICTSVIVAAELRYGATKKRSARLLKAIEDLFGEIQVLPFDLPADAEYGRIRAALEWAGTPIGGNDMLIAAHAHAVGATIISDNVREFGRVDGLTVENWLA